jgi:hypothetical protein
MTLAGEAQLYLAVVEFFRANGCEPHWRPECKSKTEVADLLAHPSTSEMEGPRQGP